MLRPGLPPLAALLGVALGVLVASASRADPPHAHPFVRSWDFPRCGAPASELAFLIQDCMQRVMYPRGVAGGERPEVEVHVAAQLCRRSRSAENGRALSACVRALMYERSGLGNRREAVPSEAAAIACLHATSVPHAEQVEDCMRRLLYTREGLGSERTGMSASAAAYACQGVAAPVPVWPFAPVCGRPSGEEAVRFLEECVRRLAFQREGLGEPRADIPPDAAALACEGALSWAP